MRLLGFAESERAIFAAVAFRQPEVLWLLVLFQVNRPNNVDDALPIRGQIRFIDITNRGEIFRLKKSPRFLA